MEENSLQNRFEVKTDDGSDDKMVTIDEHGVKTVVEIKINEKGQRVKITRRYQTASKGAKQVRVDARRGIKKFGDAVSAGAGPEKNISLISPEEILFERSKMETEEKVEDPWATLQRPTGSMVCRLCGAVNDHMFLRCPKRLLMGDSAIADKLGVAASNTNINSTEKPTGPAKYVPPSMRGKDAKPSGVTDSSGRPRGDGPDRRDEPSVRVSNLTEEATEGDLRELFGKFGRITRCTVVRDRVTNEPKGFAYLNFERQDEAQKAINKLNKHPYGNLILEVMWSEKK